MGYNTEFELESNVVGLNATGFEDNYCLMHLFQHSFYEGKWYSWDKDLKELSLSNKDKLIVVSGVGEERGDEWKAYFLNGKSVVYRPQVIYPEFNEGDLK